jgi:hypothetical protein
MDLLDKSLLNLKDNEIVGIYCYIYPKLTNTSITIEKFRYESEILSECYECGKNVVLSYHLGVMSNNIDEYYSGFCDECYEYVNYEPNYDDDDDIIRIHKNNMIVIGSRIKFVRPKHAVTNKNIDNNIINNILLDCNIYVIDVGDNKWKCSSQAGKNRRILNKKKKQIAEYISTKI